MSDQDPTQPIQPVRPADPDATQALPVTPAPTQVVTPGGPGGPVDGGPPYAAGPPDPDRRWLWAIGGVGAVILLLILFLIFDGDDETDVATTSSTTSSPSTTSFTSTTEGKSTTTAAPSTTTTSKSTKTTVAPSRCTGKTDPADPEKAPQTLYSAWRVGDMDCAKKLASNAVVNQLFDLEPDGPEWAFQGCSEETDPDPHHDCAFTYDGGSVHFLERLSPVDGWQIYDMKSVAD